MKTEKAIGKLSTWIDEGYEASRLPIRAILKAYWALVEKYKNEVENDKK